MSPVAVVSANAKEPAEAQSAHLLRKRVLQLLLILFVFVTESNFRSREFQVEITLDWQILLELGCWALCGIAGVLVGGLSTSGMKKWMFVPSSALILLMFVSTLYSPVRIESFAAAVEYTCFLVFAIGVARNLSLREWMIALAIGLSLVVLTAPILYYSHHEPAKALAESTLANRMHGLVEHSAELGADAALLAIIAFSLFARERAHSLRWLTLGVLALVVAVLSTAKTALLAFCFSALIVWWRRSTVMKAVSPVWFAGLLGIVALAAIYGPGALVPQSFLALVSRSGHPTDVLTGRDRIWGFVIDKWSGSPALGYGFDSGRYIILGYFKAWHILQTHSMYLNCLLYLGIVGLFALLCVIVPRLVSFVRTPNPPLDWIFLFILLQGIAEQSALADKPTIHTLAFFLSIVGLMSDAEKATRTADASKASRPPDKLPRAPVR